MATSTSNGDIATLSSDYKKAIAEAFLGNSKDLDAYFRLYERRFKNDQRSGATTQPSQQPPCCVLHEDIIKAAAILKQKSHLTLGAIREKLKTEVSPRYSIDQLNFLLEFTMQAMLMIDAVAPDTKPYKVGRHQFTLWSEGESLLDFVTRCFPQVSAERRDLIGQVVADKRSLKAWKLKKRLHITFEATDNLANHLLFDSHKRIIYVFHHAGYLKAHLNLWQQSGADARNVGITRAISERYLPKEFFRHLSILINAVAKRGNHPLDESGYLGLTGILGER